jgi:hypothetical protein
VVKVGDEDGLVEAIKDAQGFIGFGLWSPEPGINTFFHAASPYGTGKLFSSLVALQCATSLVAYAF